MARIALLLVIVCFFPRLAWADMAEAKAAYGRGDFKAALEAYRVLAKQGDVEAAYRLGCLYDQGKGFSQDVQSAAGWYEAAAEWGHPWAQVNLGEMYYLGDGKPQNDKKALALFLAAAEQGLGEAQLIVGSTYETGLFREVSPGNFVLEPNLEKAVEWYTRAAEKGNPEAIFYLSAMYFEGKHVPKDPDRAASYLKTASEKGYPTAQTNLGWLYYTGWGFPQDRTKAAEWYRKAAEQGSDIAQFKLAMLYLKGEGVDRDFAEAALWLHRAANWGNSEYAFELGKLYVEGLGVPQDTFEAYVWFSRAARAGHEEATAMRDTLAKKLTQAQIAAGQRRARQEGRTTPAYEPISKHHPAYPDAKRFIAGRSLFVRWALEFRGPEARRCPD